MYANLPKLKLLSGPAALKLFYFAPKPGEGGGGCCTQLHSFYTDYAGEQPQKTYKKFKQTHFSSSFNENATSITEKTANIQCHKKRQ